MDEKKLQKRELRERIVGLRDALTPAQRVALSKQVIQKILKHQAYYRSDTVMAFMSFASEVQTEELIADMLRRGKRLVLPRVDQNWRRLDLYVVKDLTRDLQPGVFGIREPRPDVCEKISLQDVQMVLVPGVAFDQYGGRLGYGVGYYDKLFASVDRVPFLLAGIFSLQVVEEVPQEIHDHPVDLIITENAEYKIDRLEKI